MIEIDDFYTHADVITGLSHLLNETRENVSIYVLLGMSNRFAMLDILEKDDDFPLYSIGVHGWNHFQESSFGYWEMRHMLEFAISWDCFNPEFVMPWNRMPTPGAIRALKEKKFTLITPYAWQRVIVTALGCNAVNGYADMLLHPPDLLNQDRLDQIIRRMNDEDSD
jgi:hypothetical protein